MPSNGETTKFFIFNEKKNTFELLKEEGTTRTLKAATPTTGKASKVQSSPSQSQSESNIPPPPDQIILKGHLQVNVNVPAKIFVEGKYTGTVEPVKALNITNLRTGKVFLEAKANGYQDFDGFKK